jgi:hypothetical protein
VQRWIGQRADDTATLSAGAVACLGVYEVGRGEARGRVGVTNLPAKPARRAAAGRHLSTSPPHASTLRHSIYSLYWYTSTSTDAEEADSALGLSRAHASSSSTRASRQQGGQSRGEGSQANASLRGRGGDAGGGGEVGGASDRSAEHAHAHRPWEREVEAFPACAGYRRLSAATIHVDHLRYELNLYAQLPTEPLCYETHVLSTNVSAPPLFI